MNRSAFHQLLKRYTDDTCTKEERELIDRWYELLDDGQATKSAGNPELEERLWNRIHSQVTRETPVRRMRTPWGWIAAATVVLAVGAAWWTVHTTTPAGVLPAHLTAGLHALSNKGAASLTDTLEDGSTVVLSPGARLAFPAHFAGDKREVYLEGSAFFAVKKNPGRPFFVYDGHVVTQVLGTTFTVTTDKGQVEVAVHSGKVAVYETGEAQEQKTNGVIVTPNEKVTYYAEDRHFVTALVDSPRSLAGKPPRFVFEDTPLPTVLDTLGKAYNIQIIVENDNLDRCSFTGDIGGQSLYQQLELICGSIRATYEIKGTNILIKGKGCD